MIGDKLAKHFKKGDQLIWAEKGGIYKIVDGVPNLCIGTMGEDAILVRGVKVPEDETNGYVEWLPGAITPIYVRWLWLDRILCKIFNPFKEIK